MTYSDPRTFGADSAPSAAVQIERIRQALAAALVVGLIALPVLAGLSTAERPQLQSGTSIGEPATGSDPVFDGRGKWGGYAR